MPVSPTIENSQISSWGQYDLVKSSGIADICGDVRKVNTLIEPVLLEDNEDSPLYREVMRTGINV